MQSRLQHMPVQVAAKQFVEMVEQAYLLKKGKDHNPALVTTFACLDASTTLSRASAANGSSTSFRFNINYPSTSNCW